MNLWRSPDYRKRFQHWHCVNCWAPSSEAAHCRIGWVGMGLEKPADSCCTPLCSWCHRTGPIAQHKGNEEAWWKARGVDPLDLAARLHRTWLADPKDAQGIYEILGGTHYAIEEFVWNAYRASKLEFDASPSPDNAEATLNAFKAHLVSLGAAEQYEQRVASLKAALDTTLAELEAP